MTTKYGLDKEMVPFAIRSTCPKCKQERWDRKFVKQEGSPFAEWLLLTCETCSYQFRMFPADHEGATA